MRTEIRNVDYNQFVHLIGTAHFTKRSLLDAYHALEKLKPENLAIELDLKRFQALNGACSTCPKRFTCTRKCEFTAATEALGNVDANVWLIDMSEEEIRRRIRRLTVPSWTRLQFLNLPFVNNESYALHLWEEGFKDRVLRFYQQRLEALRRRAPHVWRVLIDERNTLMAARLAWIVSQQLEEKGNPTVLALVGAAHVEGMKELLSQPADLKDKFRRYCLTFTPPTLIRRIRVNCE